MKNVLPNKDRPKITLLYPYFKPGYKAGGIAQSLYNLCVILSTRYKIQVICLNHDLHEKALYPFISDNQPYEIEEEHVSIVYISSSRLFKSITDSIKKFDPDYIYASSLYNVGFLLAGLYNTIGSKRKLTIAPRGMLQEGGLQKGIIKKYFYLRGLRVLLSFLKPVKWQATDEQEIKDIKKWFSLKASAHLAYATPRPIIKPDELPHKQQDELKLVYYSLITGKKNLNLMLKALQEIEIPVSLDIYGPIVEPDYWDECKSIINQLSNNISVQYHGELPFDDFAKQAHNYQYMVLPTKGENFGHVIFECLSLGLPVIISKFTPWDFENEKVGYYINLDVKELRNLFYKLYKINSITYSVISKNATRFAELYYEKTLPDYYRQYEHFFTS